MKPKQIIITFSTITIVSVLFIYLKYFYHTYYSPDHSVRIVVDEQPELILYFYSSDGKLRNSEKTPASRYQNWAIRWLNNKKVILESSDVGSIEYWQQGNGTWKSQDPTRTASPDGKWVTYTFWYSYEHGPVEICILEGTPNPEDASNVKQEFKTNIITYDLVDCIRWISSSRFILKVSTGQFMWQLSKDGKWRQVQ